jgi:hypothetical protein
MVKLTIGLLLVCVTCALLGFAALSEFLIAAAKVSGLVLIIWFLAGLSYRLITGRKGGYPPI